MKNTCDIKEVGYPVPPYTRELIDCVMQAACVYYEVTKEQLINEYKLANARHICFYIIKESSPRTFDYVIGDFFHLKRTAVQYGIGLISSHKNTYSQVLGDLKAIAELANTFDKKYSWHIQLFNMKR